MIVSIPIIIMIIIITPIEVITKKKRSHLMIGDDYETTKTNLFISFVRNKQIEDLDCFEYNKR